MTTPHDALFKYVFGQPENAAAELRTVLPAELVRRIDFSSLAAQPKSFVDEHLKARHADLLFTARLNGTPAFLYLLLEHQSSNDALMPFRLLQYQVRIWEAYLLEHPEAKRLPPVIPIVLHHSERGWTSPTSFQDVLAIQASDRPAIAEYVPQFRFLLDDISTLDDGALRARSYSALAQLGVLLLSRGRRPNLDQSLHRFLDTFGQLAQSQDGFTSLKVVLGYALQVASLAPESLRDVVTQLGPVAEEALMTAAEQLIARGRVEGQRHALLTVLSVLGPVPDEVRGRIAIAPSEQLDTWLRRVQGAKRLEDVLG